MKILFICSSNTCRSPYAEYVFRRLVENNPVLKENVESITSSAVFNKSKTMHKNTKTILLEEGFTEEELSTFQPDFILLNRKKFDEADIIIGMGYLQKFLLPLKYHKKYITLSQASIGEDVHIPDPWYNKSMDFYRNVMKMINSFLNIYADNLENQLKK